MNFMLHVALDSFQGVILFPSVLMTPGCLLGQVLNIFDYYYILASGICGTAWRGLIQRNPLPPGYAGTYRQDIFRTEVASTKSGE